MRSSYNKDRFDGGRQIPQQELIQCHYVQKILHSFSHAIGIIKHGDLIDRQDVQVECR